MVKIKIVAKDEVLPAPKVKALPEPEKFIDGSFTAKIFCKREGEFREHRCNPVTMRTICRSCLDSGPDIPGS